MISKVERKSKMEVLKNINKLSLNQIRKKAMYYSRLSDIESKKGNYQNEHISRAIFCYREYYSKGGKRKVDRYLQKYLDREALICFVCNAREIYKCKLRVYIHEKDGRKSRKCFKEPWDFFKPFSFRERKYSINMDNCKVKNVKEDNDATVLKAIINGKQCELVMYI